MRFRTAIAGALAAALAVTPIAAAHVTLNPGEWEAGGFGRFDLRVPNEQPNASTTEITVQIPEGLNSVSFQDVPGWERSVEMVQLDEPIEEEGEEPITERIGTVTWSAGEVEPGEFVEFGLSFQVPEDAAGEELLFPATQTYSNGEVVRWVQPDPEGEEPAPRLAVLPGEGDEPASTGAQEPATETGEGADASGQAGGGGGEAAAAEGGSDGEGRANLALGLGIAGLVAGLVALAVALTRSRRAAPSG